MEGCGKMLTEDCSGWAPGGGQGTSSVVFLSLMSICINSDPERMLQVANNGVHICPIALASISRIWKAWPCHVSWVKVVLRGSDVGWFWIRPSRWLCIRPSSMDRGLIAGHALHISVTVVLFSTPAGSYSTDKTVITPIDWRKSSKTPHPDWLKPAPHK